MYDAVATPAPIPGDTVAGGGGGDGWGTEVVPAQASGASGFLSLLVRCTGTGADAGATGGIDVGAEASFLSAESS